MLKRTFQNYEESQFLCGVLILLRKQAVSSQNAELEALEARLRATEERLKERQSRSSSPMTGTSRYISPQRRPPVGRTLSNQPNGSPTALRSPPVTGVSSSARPAIAGTKAPSYSVAEMPGAFEPPLETVTSKKNKSTMREGVFCREQ